MKIELRKIEEKVFKVLMIAAALTILGSLLLIVATVVVKGIGAMRWSMITQTPQGGFYLGKEGGVLNAIVGSLYIAAGGTALALLLALPGVMYMNVYAKRNSRWVEVMRFSLDVLWGVPSIVYGAFGFTVMLWLGMKASLLGGIITVGLLIFPIMSRAMDEVMRLTPGPLLEASYALGATRWEAARVAVRQSFAGLITGMLIAMGRGIGDAASVLFTAGFSDAIPNSLTRPAATLPLAIFFQLGTPSAQVQERAYASALLLTGIILLISVVCRSLSKRMTRHVV